MDPLGSKARMRRRVWVVSNAFTQWENDCSFGREKIGAKDECFFFGDKWSKLKECLFGSEIDMMHEERPSVRQ